MGCRFKSGRQLGFVPREKSYSTGFQSPDITDGCCPYGSTQVPNGAEPIVLHRDAVSDGDYFMLGAAVSADMDLIGQLQPNTPTRFVKVEMDAALSARKDRSAMLDRIREATP